MAKILIVLAVVCAAYLVSADELSAGEDKIRFYTGATSDEYTDYPIGSGEEVVSNNAWDSNKPIIIFLHGMNGDVEDESTVTVVTAYLGRADHNVLAIDYASRAKLSGDFVTGLTTILNNAILVGEVFGELINRLVEAGVKLSSLHLVAYNIGVHIAGHGARNANGTVSRLTALDPYIHAFYLFGNDDHLWSTDAETVDVIHTNGIIESVATSTGTVDFYPNGGHSFQPGCSFGLSSEALTCSTKSAYKYYAESVTNPTAFPAISCDSWTQFEAGSCKGETDYMGYGYSLNKTGNFYLQTYDASPYSKGDDGIIYDGSKLTVISATWLEWITSGLSSIFG